MIVKLRTKILFTLLFFGACSGPDLAHAEQAPRLLLAKTYHESLDLSDYWLSEKLDGVRAYWDGEKLLSRQGNEFVAPSWFTEKFPTISLDGELWIGREQFESTLSAVSKLNPLDAEWRKIKYMLFELPESKGTFTQRLRRLKQVVEELAVPHLQVVSQVRITNDHEALQVRLDKIVQAGGEGLMLHRADALYQTGRSNDLLKVKKFEDAEALVIAHLAGKGKHLGKLGALLLRTPEGLEFKVGSGFSDYQRTYPPAIGCQITYKFYGLTNRGVPRFASFLRKASRDHNLSCD